MGPNQHNAATLRGLSKTLRPGDRLVSFLPADDIRGSHPPKSETRVDSLDADFDAAIVEAMNAYVTYFVATTEGRPNDETLLQQAQQTARMLYTSEGTQYLLQKVRHHRLHIDDLELAPGDSKQPEALVALEWFSSFEDDHWNCENAKDALSLLYESFLH